MVAITATDEEHLQLALTENRVTFTRDSDFLRLHSSKTNHAGIVYSPYQTSIGEMIRGLILVYEILEVEEMRGRVECL